MLGWALALLPPHGLGQSLCPCRVPKGHSWSCWEESVPLCGWGAPASAQVSGMGNLLPGAYTSSSPCSCRRPVSGRTRGLG